MSDGDSQRRLAVDFGRLHHGPDVLVLPNAWDAASARLFEIAGAKAIGTTSAGIAASAGYPDGERISRDELLRVVRRIVDTVSLPVSVDIEMGYGNSAEEILDTIRAVIDTGAVGVNLEDASRTDPGGLNDLAWQVRLVAEVHDLVQQIGIPLFINARTDTYWLKVGDPAQRTAETIRRANAYRDAGASGLFVPGVTDPELLRALVAGIQGPLNVLATPGCPRVAELKALGVARVSVGSGPMRATLGLVRRMANELIGEGRYDAITAETIPYAEVNRLFDR